VRELALAAVLVLAGCGGLTGGAPTTSTLTPADVQPAPAYPPGIDEDGVVDPDVLARAHGERDDEVSYTLVSNRTVGYANGTVRSRLTVRVELAADRTYFARAVTDGRHGPVFLGNPPATAEFWSNGTTYVRALDRDGERVYNTFEPPDQYAGTWRYWARTVAFGGRAGFAGATIRDTFGAIPTRVAGRERTRGTTLTRLVGTEATGDEFTSPAVDAPRNVRLDATVDERGLMRSLDLRYEGTVDGENVTVHRSIAYEDVGSTTVTRPEWFDRAVGQ